MRPASLLLYESSRERLLRLVTIVCFVPFAIAASLIPLAPRDEWAAAPLGGWAWWLLPALLIGFTLALPASLFFLHRRYVLRLSLEPDDSVQTTTFLLWGRRTQRCPVAEFDSRRLIFDRAGHAPRGLEFAKAPATGPWFTPRPPRAERFVSRRIQD